MNVPATSPKLHWPIAIWGVLGVLALLGQAMRRLGVYAAEALDSGLTPGQWAALAVWVCFSLYGEGYRAFHLRFSPRVVARALHLARHPKPLYVLLAPLFCMTLFHATKRGKIVAWSTVGMVLVFILLLRQTPQPWRGIVDAGVVAALFLGSLSICYHLWRAASGTPPSAPSLLPEGAPADASV